MKLKLLPTTFDTFGRATSQQHFCCFIIDDCVAIDAGSLATATTLEQKKRINDIVLTHAHLDHIAGLPIFIDDLFVSLAKPLRIHTLTEVIEVLEEHVFNWKVYPRFSELHNSFGNVIEYLPFNLEEDFVVSHLKLKAVLVNHKVPSVGLIIRDGKAKIAFTGDTAETERFWSVVNEEDSLDAVFIECAFPNELEELATSSYHLTPSKLQSELKKLKKDCPVYVINIKPVYREKVIAEIKKLKHPQIQILEVGRSYRF